MIKIHAAMLWSDWLMWGLVAVTLIAALFIRKKPHLRDPWKRILQRKLGMIALVVLLAYCAIALLDCIHLQITTTGPQQQTHLRVKSVLDLALGPLSEMHEKTYSAPFATTLHSPALTTLPDGREVRMHAPLLHGGPDRISTLILLASLIAIPSFLLIAFLICALLSRRQSHSLLTQCKLVLTGNTKTAWREAFITGGVLWTGIWIVGLLASHYHVLGTDKVGQDVLYQTLKSIRTGLIIGTLTTLFMLPFALILGTMAGYFRGWVDDLIQYVYTTLSSIPGVLLISASILVLQVYIHSHSALFPTLLERADARLLALCLILGITSWANLCRLLRGETLKLRELEFIQAAKALGVKQRKIITRHIVPNLLHIVIITLVLDFSGLVLAEAVLSYVGVGVDPTTMSWGNMINSSRFELAREPMVWWPLLASLIFMFLLVLAANIFADTVRDALDPRLRNTPS